VGAVVATLRAKVAQAEKDAKAYKARIRSVETLERSKADLSDKVEALETRLLASEGAAAAHEATLEEMRRRAVVAEAKANPDGSFDVNVREGCAHGIWLYDAAGKSIKSLATYTIPVGAPSDIEIPI
jgi:hypothetical protein